MGHGAPPSLKYRAVANRCGGVPYGSVRGKMFFVPGQFTFAEQLGRRFSRVPGSFTQSWPAARHAIKDLSQSVA